MLGQQGLRPDMTPNPQQAHQLLVQNNIDPQSLSQTQLQTFQSQPTSVQEKSIKVFANNFPQARPNMQAMVAQGGPMMQHMNDEYFAANPTRGAGPVGQNGANNNGNHALHDYQMQLMLLEQQNKKRLLMARQEQDNIRSSDGQLVNPQGAFAPPMSPQGSRSGPSPNPNDMKREEAKMGQMGSPMPDGMPHGRGSPGPLNFNPQNMPMEMIQKMQGMGGDAAAAGQMPGGIRPPSSHPSFPTGPNGQPMDPMRAAAAQQQAAAAAAAAGPLAHRPPRPPRGHGPPPGG